MPYRSPDSTLLAKLAETLFVDHRDVIDAFGAIRHFNFSHEKERSLAHERLTNMRQRAIPINVKVRAPGIAEVIIFRGSLKTVLEELFDLLEPNLMQSRPPPDLAKVVQLINKKIKYMWKIVTESSSWYNRKKLESFFVIEWAGEEDRSPVGPSNSAQSLPPVPESNSKISLDLEGMEMTTDEKVAVLEQKVKELTTRLKDLKKEHSHEIGKIKDRLNDLETIQAKLPARRY